MSDFFLFSKTVFVARFGSLVKVMDPTFVAPTNTVVKFPWFHFPESDILSLSSYTPYFVLCVGNLKSIYLFGGNVVDLNRPEVSCDVSALLYLKVHTRMIAMIISRAQVKDDRV